MVATADVTTRSAYETKQILGRDQVLINPSWSQVKKALTTAQTRTRINRLPEQSVKQALKKVEEGVEELVTLGIVTCPHKFFYDLNSTVFQAIRIGENLVGVFISRLSASPGTETQPPLRHKSDTPTPWCNEVINTFWTQLTEQQMDEIRQRRVLSLLPQSVTSMEFLLGFTRPKFVSEATIALRDLAKQLQEHGLDSMSWADLKKFDQKTTTRYPQVLLSLAEDNRITIQSMLEYCNANKFFGLAYQRWDGPSRIFDAPQLVINVQCPKLIRSTLQKLPQNTTDLLKGVARHHPTELETIGWLRIHLDQVNQIIFIDEVQSDFLEEMRSFQQEWHDPDHERAATEAVAVAEPWARHGVATCLQWAREMGFRLGFHTWESAMCTRDMTRSPRKWTTYYGKLIKRFNFQQMEIPGYPEKIHILE